MRPIAVRLPEEAIRELDSLAKTLGMKRSDLIRKLIGLGLRCLERGEW